MKYREPKLRDQGRAIRWLMPRVYRADKKLTIGVLAVAPFQALLPTAVTVVFGGLAATVTRPPSGVPTLDGRTIFWLCVLACVMFAWSVAWSLYDYLQQRLAQKLELYLSRELLSHSGLLDLAQFEDPAIQDCLHRAMRHAGRGSLKFFQQTVTIAITLIEICSLLGVLLCVAWLPSLVMLAAAAPMFWLQWKFTRRRHRTGIETTKIDRLANYFRSKVTNTKMIASTKLLGLTEHVIDRYSTAAEKVHAAYQKQYRLEAWGYVAGSAVFLLGMSAAVGINISQVFTGRLEPHLFIVFWMATWRFRNSMESLASRLSSEMESGLGLMHLVEFMEVQPEITGAGTHSSDACHGRIELIDVRFTYPGVKKPVINGLNLTIEPGEKVMIVGSNGAGKTTLAKLVSRLYEVESGSIRIDGVDLRDWRPESLHKHIAFAFQHSVAYEGSVHENLAYGDVERLMHDRDAVRLLAESTGVNELIDALPSGYDTGLGRMFGEVDLSGGQWQRLCLTRSLGRQAAIVIMDEPTASLDAQTEDDLYTRLETKLAGQTVLIISHKFTSTRLADRIVVLKDGRIAEQGSHDELLEANGHYASLWRRQTQHIGAGMKHGRRRAG